ncbi:uncharacterized protein G2W53_014365 [Senna tora]|uniref:Uncharacterized protein n=1 Tax=Senna tora TaxID=362788 RepID=A0A834WTE3_9FABA|nr:uncharacterized protein G2W53_014365 [Senna tora]
MEEWRFEGWGRRMEGGFGRGDLGKREEEEERDKIFGENLAGKHGGGVILGLWRRVGTVRAVEELGKRREEETRIEGGGGVRG